MIKLERLSPDILSKIPACKKALFEEDNIIFAYIFGGLAEGKVKPLSDIDIAVFLRDTQNLAEIRLKLFDILAGVFGAGEIDLVILNTATISLSGRILQRRQILVDKDPFQRHLYESVMLRKFFDFKIKEDIYFFRRYGVGR